MKLLPFILSVFVLIFSCNTVSKETYVKNIETLGEEVKEITVFEGNETVEKLIENYEGFASNFPDDPQTPEYLFKLAEFYGATGDNQKELETFKKVSDNYQDYEKAPQSLFMQAFILENKLNALKEAEKIYQMFMEKYPDHEFADDAQFSLDNLYLTDEQLLEKFKQINAAKDSAE